MKFRFIFLARIEHSEVQDYIVENDNDSAETSKDPPYQFVIVTVPSLALTLHRSKGLALTLTLFFALFNEPPQLGLRG